MSSRRYGQPGAIVWTGVSIFALALALRLLFLYSLPDPGAAANPY
jgi:hypothetical protein